MIVTDVAKYTRLVPGLLLSLMLLLSGCSWVQQTFTDSSDLDPLQDFRFPPPEYLGSSPISVWAGHYFNHLAELDEDGKILLDTDNQPLTAELDETSWCQGALIGQLSLQQQGEWRTYHAVDQRGPRQLDCNRVLEWKPGDPNIQIWAEPAQRTRFEQSRGPFGDGVRGFELVPFRTLAVDPHRIRYGSLLFIPALVGAPIELPDGRKRRHDGYFMAADSGRAIRGSHVLLFQGVESENAFPEQVFNRSDRRLKVWVIEDAPISGQLRAAHRPSENPSPQSTSEPATPAPEPIPESLPASTPESAPESEEP